MENSRKTLKILSIVIIILAAMTFASVLIELCYGELNNAVIPEGAPENTMAIAKTVLLSVSVLLLLPQVYVGVKGLMVARKPNSSKGHIVWAIILTAISVLGMIEPVIDLINKGEVYENSSSVLSLITETLVYLEYIKYARKLKQECLAESCASTDSEG